jgi:hypothetical protein
MSDNVEDRNKMSLAEEQEIRKVEVARKIEQEKRRIEVETVYKVTDEDEHDEAFACESINQNRERMNASNNK